MTEHAVLIIALSVSFGIVYVDNLTAPGGLLDFLDGSKWPGKLGHLFTCSVCVTGQCALWSYIGFTWNNYDPFEHVVVIFVSMCITYIINRILP